MFGEHSSADGNYEVTLMTKATVYYDGRVVWEVRDIGSESNDGEEKTLAMFFLASSHLQIQLHD